MGFLGQSATYEAVSTQEFREPLNANIIDGDGDARTWSPEAIQENANTYAFTGATIRSWDEYFMWPVFAMLTPIIVTMAVRLYTGHGYIDSFTKTLTERHILVWAKSM